MAAKPGQEKQVGGLIPFENNRKWQPFLVKQKLALKQTNVGSSVPAAEEETFL